MPTTNIPSHPDVAILADEAVWRGRFPLQRVQFRHRRFDGEMSPVRTWELWRRGRAAAVLPYDPVQDCVVLIEQFRLPALAAGLDPVLVELAAGLADGDEAAEATIRRESVEEMGLTLGRVERVGDFLLTPGGCDERCVIFAGEVALPEPGEGGVLGHHGLDAEHEDIRVCAVPAMAAIEIALAGGYPNSVTTIGLLWLAAKREWLRKKWLEGGSPQDKECSCKP